MSPLTNASIASEICCSTKPPICSTLERKVSSSASNCFDICTCSVIFASPFATRRPTCGLYHGPAASLGYQHNSSVSPRPFVGLHSSWGAQQEQVGWPAGEQAVGHDTGELIDFAFQRRGIDDVQAVDVEDQVSVVGRKPLAQSRAPAQLDHLS